MAMLSGCLTNHLHHHCQKQVDVRAPKSKHVQYGHPWPASSETHHSFRQEWNWPAFTIFIMPAIAADAITFPVQYLADAYPYGRRWKP